MDLHDRVFTSAATQSDLAAWAASGAMNLTGPAEAAPQAAPASLAPTLQSLAAEIAASSERLGRRVELDALALLGERAAIAGFSRHGRRSCGGSTELLPAADGWLAVALPRPEDLELLPAWLGGSDVADRVGRRARQDLVASAAVLGLAVSALAEVHATRPAFVVSDPLSRPIPADAADVVVVDLSALWAGPLTANVLTLTGCRVIKVESCHRPDGGRFGPPLFYDLLHAGQESVAFDFADPADINRLATLLSQADVVIEASRPRALANLGIAAEEVLAEHGVVWLSITGYGRADGARVAFGDDAAVAGGLVAGSSDDPWFCADALADPLAGLTGAAVVLDLLSTGHAGLVDLSMAHVAAWCARLPPTVEKWDGETSPPRSRTPLGQAPPLGADTAAVVAEYAPA
jgi:crotonobetainyl-CoA:carnitine CoA-transferase CaiB-like acyl-CoA transferase